MMDLVEELGFLPFFDCGIDGFSADELVDPACRYRPLPDGGWDWPLWDWKGPIVKETHCAYGKFFNGKAGFVSREWWPDFCNWRRSLHPAPAEDSIEGIILDVLHLNGSMITRNLRNACGLGGPKLRGKFDGYTTRLEMAARVVIEDFVYAHDKHNRPYGWGLALLNTPENLLGRELCQCDRTPDQSYRRMVQHLRTFLPNASENQLDKLLS